eukprot:CAMPEP_0116874320 /NCGR_PEP_ID=MMETSP0463-20121206/5750_1 /TAXON_ID=181622 /ORGANISM="Strombidinopsis sp, Strain SopsisLIS2011" /LENGTH=133 /DNA_ID=CAMNT_0004517783 /DNA_START=26 /DNA_END=424 /DNA_ORIENTATION=-
MNPKELIDVVSTRLQVDEGSIVGFIEGRSELIVTPSQVCHSPELLRDVVYTVLTKSTPSEDDEATDYPRRTMSSTRRAARSSKSRSRLASHHPMESDSGYEYEDDGYQAKKVSSNMGLPPRHNHAVSYGQNMW